MDAELNEVITPVEVKIESEDGKVELGPASREALRIEQVQRLKAWLDEITPFVDESLPPLDDLLRAQLEDLQRACDGASKAAGALWWLIPADVYTEGDE